MDKLEPGAGYEVGIEAVGYEAHSTDVTLDKSLNIGLVLPERT